MKFLAAKKALELLPRLAVGVLALVVVVIFSIGSGIGAIVMLDSEKTSSPSSGEVALSGFTHPLGGPKRFDTYNSSSHAKGAIDFPVPPGTPIYAAADGVIVASGWQGTYGIAVTIEHAGGVGTHYAHMSQARVTAGQTVTAGTVIGLVGSTGKSSGPHLHFEGRDIALDWNTIRPTYKFMLERGVDLGSCFAGPCRIAGA